MVFITCGICGFYNTSGLKLIEHIGCHFNESLYKCKLCTLFEGKCSEDLHYHLKASHNSEPLKFTCPLCLQFHNFSVINIAEHILTKNCPVVKGKYFCKFQCHFFSDSPGLLFQHILSKHFPTVTVYRFCTDCDLSWTSVHPAKQHMQDKHGIEYDSEEPVESVEVCCSLCPNYTCRRKDTLIRHMTNKHLGVSYTCPFPPCAYNSIVFSDFSQHVLLTHLQTKTWYYTCPECDIGFLAPRSLEQHLLDKHEIDDYCSVCDSCWDGLVNHLYHDHKLTFSKVSCRLCNGFEFDEDSDLLAHLKSNHGIHVLDTWDMVD